MTMVYTTLAHMITTLNPGLPGAHYDRSVQPPPLRCSPSPRNLAVILVSAQARIQLLTGFGANLDAL